MCHFWGPKRSLLRDFVTILRDFVTILIIFCQNSKVMEGVFFPEIPILWSKKGGRKPFRKVKIPL